MASKTLAFLTRRACLKRSPCIKAEKCTGRTFTSVASSQSSTLSPEDHINDILAAAPSQSTSIGQKEREVLLRCASKTGKSRNSPETFYSLTADDLARAGGSKILETYHEDLFAIATAAFPALPLEPWRFSGGALRCVSDAKYRRRFLLWLKEELKIHDHSQWRGKLRKELLQKIGISIPPISIKNALREEFSDVDWNAQFGPNSVDRVKPLRVPEESDTVNTTPEMLESYRKTLDTFLDTVESQGGLDRWYRVKLSQIEQNQDVADIVKKFNGYLSVALKRIYPEHAWDEWRLGDVPKGFWSDLANKKKFFDSLLPSGETLQWWYNVSAAWVLQHPGGAGALNVRKNELPGALKEI
eukprot:TRINITY_DN10412_c0_g1_i1.p1 TRINITY_DN10412_c0_g1~~TRINITY_DN10412_c0_g1_i1.p1  ORF type:complete len:357 (+),score=49.13 TRINITY_DN10412_c0_g1_i1:72-1142(+)